MADKPFEVEIDCGAGSVVRFTLSDEELLTDRDPIVRGTAQAGDRTALCTAAFDHDPARSQSRRRWPCRRSKGAKREALGRRGPRG
jgi:hypothetical protein